MEIGEMACATPAWSSRGHALKVQMLLLIHGRQPEVTILVLFIDSRNNTNGKQPLLTSGIEDVNACALIAMPK